jgi:hypothetical protein
MAIALVQQAPQVPFGDVTTATTSFSTTPGASSTVIVTTTCYPGSPSSFAVTVGGVAAVVDHDIPGPSTTQRIWRAHGPFSDGDVVLSAGEVLYGAVHAAEFSGIADDPVLYSNGDTPPTWDYPDPGVAGALAVTIAADDNSTGAGHWVAPSGYTLLLDYAHWDIASSGAGAYRILGAAAGGSATWGTSGIQTLAGVVYAPAEGGGADELDGDDLASGAPTLTSPALTQQHALGQTHTLAAAGLATPAPLLTSPALGQHHELSGADLASGTPTLTPGALTQLDELVGQDLASGQPTLSTWALGQVHALLSAALSTGQPSLTAPALGQHHALVAQDLTAGVPTLTSITHVGEEVAATNSSRTMTITNPSRAMSVASAARAMTTNNPARSFVAANTHRSMTT